MTREAIEFEIRKAFGRMVALIIALTLLLSSSTAQEPSSHVWSHLKHGTGWVMLGIISDSGKWETLPSFENVTNPRFEAPPLPGQKIRLTAPHSVYIAGYGKQLEDESRRLEVPAYDGKVSDMDEVGVEFPAGTQLMVEVMAVGAGYGPKRVVWARVVPPLP